MTDVRNEQGEYRDVDGKELTVGDKVVKASRVGNSAYLDVREITKITDDGKMYLCESNVPIQRIELLAKID